MEIDLKKVLEFSKPLFRSWRFTLGIVLLTIGIACYSLSLAIAAAGAVLLAQDFRKQQLADCADLEAATLIQELNKCGKLSIQTNTKLISHSQTFCRSIFYQFWKNLSPGRPKISSIG